MSVYKSNRKILEKLSEDELNLSRINKSILLSYFTKYRDQLIRLGIEIYRNETKIESTEEYPEGEEGSEKDKPKVIKSYGPGIGFGIAYAICFHFLKNGEIEKLSQYLKNRRILHSKKFQKRLNQYFNMTKK